MSDDDDRAAAGDVDDDEEEEVDPPPAPPPPMKKTRRGRVDSKSSPAAPKLFPHPQWNEIYSPYENPFPHLPPGSRRLDVGGKAPGVWANWCTLRGNDGVMTPRMQIAKYYYDKDTNGIKRTADGKGMCRVLNSFRVDMNVDETARQVKTALEFLAENGITVDKLKKLPDDV